MLGLLRVGLGVLLLLWAEEAPCRYVERLAGESEVLPRPGRDLGPSIRQEEVICVQKASLQGDLELGQALQLILPKGVQVRAHPSLLKRRVNMAARKQSVKSLLDELAEKAALHWQWDTAPQTLLFKAREGQAPPKETIARPSHGAGNVPHSQPKPAATKEAAKKENANKEAPCTYLVAKACVAERLAAQLGLRVQDFCAWNHIGPHTPLGKGYRVYVRKPPEGTEIVANLPSAPEGFEERHAHKMRQKAREKELPQASSLTRRTTASQAEPLACASHSASHPRSEAKGMAAKSEKAPVLPSAKALEDRPQREQDTLPAPFQHQANSVSSPKPMAAQEDALSSQRPHYRLLPGPLSAQLATWCRQALADLVWRADCELEIAATLDFGQSFEEAVRHLFRGLAAQGQGLRATFYRGNRVLEVRGQ